MNRPHVLSPTPLPPAPPRAAFAISAMFKLRDAKRRWPHAARAAVCMGVPVLIGWAAGDIPAGLMSTIGAFTALYGGDRPYLNRAIHLAVVAVSFAVSVGLGVWAASDPWLVVSTVALIAVVATFLCSALRVPPPGAYMFALACAVGTGLPAAHLSPIHAGLLVLAGGAFAWVMHMAGALFRPRGPEKAAVAAAGQAVARFIEAVGKPQQDAARHSAAMAMYEAWTTLISHQPARPRPNGALSRLRALSRELNVLFADAVNAVVQGRTMPASAAATARRLADQANNPPGGREHTDPGHIPLGHPGAARSLRQALRPWSPAMLTAARVGIAALLAGMIGVALGFERAYWTIATAVLVLYQGLSWAHTLQRGVERMSGTWVGLILAGAVLAAHPQGLWLVATLMVLQFVIEITVMRNYALAVVFITAAALTIAAGGHAVADIGHLLWVRGVDTTIGCVVGLAVFLLTTPQAAAVRIPQEIAATLDATAAMVGHLAQGTSATPSAQLAHRDLQQRTIALLQAYDASVGAASRHRVSAERMWPAVVATERLAYRVLSVHWTLEKAGKEAASELFGAIGEDRIRRALAELAAAVRAGRKPAPISDLPSIIGAEVKMLGNCLVYETTP